MGGRLADKQSASANKVPTIRPSVSISRSSSYHPSTDRSNANLEPNDKIKNNEQNLDYDRQVKTASTELFNDVRVESTSQRGRLLLNILMETEQNMRKQRRERLHMDESHRNDGSTITVGKPSPLFSQNLS
ncbi:hypothetical protein N7489_003643 [Penicillium chrysogenum]|uniref:Uncharacterized protein n=1 Tax=Penicillium chrysogenum TaxID=5076 RepID=A0ABQ8WBZ3_PENCH|nr:uncharacterized protein N7489_003643 [Penicillium chrysogenum]KAJ5253233.1 hypothetical protein N7489_003643 [Penicillium chrysogenum]KAJ5260456.1 hypothetical protein N7505_009837 [Penicillium chrysogenum]